MKILYDRGSTAYHFVRDLLSNDWFWENKLDILGEDISLIRGYHEWQFRWNKFQETWYTKANTSRNRKPE